MAILLPILLLLIVVFVVAFTYRDGFWNNLLRFVNVLLATLVAINFWEPVAGILENMYAGATYFWDFLALWALFCVTYTLLNLATLTLSKVKVRFKMVMDQAAGITASVLTGWLLMSFVTLTLHTAPLAERFMFGGFDPQSRLVFGTAPDRMLLAFCKFLSKGSLSRSIGEGQVNEFDPKYEFINKYAQRRRTYEEYLKQNAQGPRDLLVPEAAAPRRFRSG
ncbi:MAG: CvpA family protein [Thermoguttaceae bacterium]|nr:CvpA family protein [Thermoguttaceae bacterium]MDW8080137.1 CvpA family protein [Thermoguttaceae bacterium]